MDTDIENIRESLLGRSVLPASSFSYRKLLELWESEFSSPPLSGRFISWLMRDEGIKFEGDFATTLMASCSDPGAFSTLANMLSNGSLSVSSFNDECISTLLEVASDRERFHGLRGQALLLLSLISVDSACGLRSIRAYLFKFDIRDDSRYLNYLAAAVGLLSSHVKMGEAEEHLNLLSCVDGAAEEASLQLGFLCLASGLDSSNRADVLSYFERAREKFKISASFGSARLDAQLLSQCLAILLKLHNGLKSNLTEELEKFNETLFEYSALLLHSEEADRLTGSRVEESYRWMLFSTRLSMLYSNFEEKTWLEAARVIEEQLFFVYCAQRSIFGRNEDGGVSAIVKPIIHGRIQENGFHLSAVKAWLEKSEGKGRDWNELYKNVNEWLESDVFRNSISVNVVPTSPVIDIQDELTRFSNGNDWLNQQFSESTRAFEMQLPSPAVNVLKDKLCIFLQSCLENEDIINHKDAKHLFFHLFDRIITFLVARISMPSSKVNTTRYLLKDFEDVVKEEHLQDDLFDFLQTGIFSTNNTYEPRKHAGGRSDIKITYINVNTVIELKKIDARMTDEEILCKYAPQASTYQVSDANFCFLGVLDNYDNDGLQVDLRDSLSCHHWAPKNGVTRYSVIIFRVQGKRRPPSALSKKIKSGD
jgi:hypothetical protein